MPQRDRVAEFRVTEFAVLTALKLMNNQEMLLFHQPKAHIQLPIILHIEPFLLYPKNQNRLLLTISNLIGKILTA